MHGNDDYNAPRWISYGNEERERKREVCFWQALLLPFRFSFSFREYQDQDERRCRILFFRSHYILQIAKLISKLYLVAVAPFTHLVLFSLPLACLTKADTERKKKNPGRFDGERERENKKTTVTKRERKTGQKTLEPFSRRRQQKTWTRGNQPSTKKSSSRTQIWCPFPLISPRRFSISPGFFDVSQHGRCQETARKKFFLKCTQSFVHLELHFLRNQTRGRKEQSISLI